jgi:hypothetical protein
MVNPLPPLGDTLENERIANSLDILSTIDNLGYADNYMLTLFTCYRIIQNGQCLWGMK